MSKLLRIFFYTLVITILPSKAFAMAFEPVLSYSKNEFAFMLTGATAWKTDDRYFIGRYVSPRPNYAQIKADELNEKSKILARDVLREFDRDELGYSKQTRHNFKALNMGFSVRYVDFKNDNNPDALKTKSKITNFISTGPAFTFAPAKEIFFYYAPSIALANTYAGGSGKRVIKITYSQSLGVMFRLFASDQVSAFSFGFGATIIEGRAMPHASIGFYTD